MIYADSDEVRRRERPAQIAFMDDEGNFVAWTKDLSQGLATSGDKIIPIPEFDFASVSADQAGKYLCLSNAKSGDTRLFAIAEPGQNLIRFTSDFHVTSVASKPGKVWMIGHRIGPHQRGQGEVWLFRNNGVEWAKESQAILPDKFNVSKVDPFSDWCLLHEVTDMPWRRFLLFNPVTGKRSSPSRAEVFLFLKEDFLSNRLKR